MPRVRSLVLLATTMVAGSSSLFRPLPGVEAIIGGHDVSRPGRYPYFAQFGQFGGGLLIGALRAPRSFPGGPCVLFVGLVL